MERRPVVAVGAVAVNDGAILLIRRGRPPAEGRWSLPGGRVEWGEPLTDALRREVEEETALRVEVGRLAGVVERIYGDAPARLRGDGGEPEAERTGAAALEHPEKAFHYVILDYFVTVTGGDLRPGGDVTAARWVGPAELAELSLSDGLLEALEDFGVAFD